MRQALFDRVRFDPGPRTRAAVLMALVGVLGILVGVGLGRATAGRAPAVAEAPGPGADAPRWGRSAAHRDAMRVDGRFPVGRARGMRFSERIESALELTPAQKVAIDSILAEGRSRVRALAREYRPRFRAIVAETRRDMEGVLTEAQRERLRDLRSRRREGAAPRR
ncbi:MAG TPA: hypothetical protein VF212_17830 [Longimicrobiales bacterium]